LDTGPDESAAEMIYISAASECPEGPGIKRLLLAIQLGVTPRLLDYVVT